MKQNSKDIFSANIATPYRCTPTLSKDRVHIKNIKDSMINIQAILARHYLYKRDFKFTNSIDSTLCLTDNMSQEIEMFASIFDEVIVTKRSNGTPINVQVSCADNLTYEVFAEMIDKNEIDEYIKHLTIERHHKDDFYQKAYFEINKYESKIVKNRYFDFLINGTVSPTMLNPLYIDVSGFSIDEIEQDEYVQQLAAQVKNLYLIVFKNETPEISFYSKQLRWYL